MSKGGTVTATHDPRSQATRAEDPPSCPMSLRMDQMAAMLNAELADHPLYDGFELQWFDDSEHGTGMLAFLSRREDRTIDYYVQDGLRVHRGAYGIGGGIRSWNVIDFDEAALEVAEDGVVARAVFADVDGRAIEIAIDDRDGEARQRGALLAPVGAGIDAPSSLMLVWMPEFDLVRAGGDKPPVIRIDGDEAAVGRLPGAGLHRRHLIKYAAKLRVVEFNRDRDAPATIEGGAGEAELSADPAGHGRGVSSVTATLDDHIARVSFRPPFPDLRRLDAGEQRTGQWRIGVDRRVLTGGSWRVTAAADRAEVHLDVTRPWRPHALPWLMRVVTTVLPVFRRWPTSYAWRATVPAAGGTTRARWERSGAHTGAAYRDATGR